MSTLLSLPCLVKIALDFMYKTFYIYCIKYLLHENHGAHYYAARQMYYTYNTDHTIRKIRGNNCKIEVEVYVGSTGPGVQWDPVTENRVVPVHREICKYTIILSSPGPIEHRVPLNPHIHLVSA